jgi:dephospho-CoA kinase
MAAGIRIIGLTGGIATGKSSVALFFSNHGIPVIDADQLAREAVLPGSPALEQIKNHFGSDVVSSQDGQLDRKRLGALVFADSAQRHILENTLHPEIRRLAEVQIDRARSEGHQRLIYMAPLLIEAGATDRVDTVWVVTVRPEIQLDRLMRRDGISPEQAQHIIDSQMPLAEKERYGDVVIDNSGSESETVKLMEAAWLQETGISNE